MAEQNSMPLAVVILAAGKGTRMKSKLPKVLHRIGGRSLIEHVLSTAEGLNPEHIVAVVRHDRDRVAQAITDFTPDAIIVDQDEVPGTGRAVEQAVEALPESFTGTVVVLSGDVPLITSDVLHGFIALHEAEGRAMTMMSAIVENPTGLGRILRNAGGQVHAIVEEKDASDAEREVKEINGGVYAFQRTSLQDALTQIDTNNAQGEKYLTDAAARILAGGGRVEAEVIADTWVLAGVNDRTQLAQAARELNARIVRGHQRNGVAIVSPETTFIDVQVQIDSDAEILPGTFLQGSTRIHEGAIVGPDSTIVDSVIEAEAWVRRSEIYSAVVSTGATVGPFSYIRPGTELGANGKIGAFVEAKNAKIGEGSKVPHLSYVGDIHVGENANIGAGTIVANYDGVNKHTSVVGDSARVGSKNVLVSPVNVGAGAYTAAGAVVRKDVPAGALGMSVAPQRNIKEWVAQNRPETDSAEAAKKENEQ